ncbi:MAG: hypothetical protein ACRDNS_07620 [Trebonia sp.]
MLGSSGLAGRTKFDNIGRRQRIGNTRDERRGPSRIEGVGHDVEPVAEQVPVEVEGHRRHLDLTAARTDSGSRVLRQPADDLPLGRVLRRVVCGGYIRVQFGSE